MSRIANNPIKPPSGVELNVNGSEVSVKGPKGALSCALHPDVALEAAEGEYRVSVADDRYVAMAGTYRSLVNNMVIGVSEGFTRALRLVGVGYRAQLKGKNLELTLGYSHPIEFPAPDGIEFEVPSQTDIVVKGCDKQRVGQVAAEIRALRPPEPYKGKGVRYAEERVIRKEAKKA